MLTVETRNGSDTFTRTGEVIDFNYVITNTGTARLAGPALVTDTPRQITCPEINTVGNGDIYLDQNETITCTASYTITDVDVSTGSVSLATANVGGLSVSRYHTVRVRQSVQWR
jgi:uncharacterized repeat protein (TIGR01451 family)